MAGRPDDDDDLDPGEANSRDIDDIDKRAKEMEREAEPGPREDDEDDDPEAYLVEEERAPRRERRSARYDELQEEAARERARAAAFEAQLLAQQRPQQQAAPQVTFQEFESNVRARLQELQQAEITLQVLADGKDANSDAFKGLLAQKIQIDLEKAELGHLYAQAKHAPPPQRQIAPEMAHMKAMYADVDNDPAGAAYAQGYYLQQVKRGVKKPAIEIVKEAYEYARATLAGKPFSSASQGRPRPTVESKARLTGASTGGNGQGSTRAPQRVTMAKEDAAMAHETYKYIKDPQKRLQLYHKEIVLPREREASSERRRA